MWYVQMSLFLINLRNVSCVYSNSTMAQMWKENVIFLTTLKAYRLFLIVEPWSLIEHVILYSQAYHHRENEFRFKGDIKHLTTEIR